MQRWILTLALSAATTVAAAQPDPARQAALLHLLQQDCGSCHGLTMRGGLGPALLPHTLAGKPKDFLVRTIIDGRPGTAMPPRRPFLNEQEAAWLVDRLMQGEGGL